MDKSLLKKAAIQSVVLMMTVITSSFALKQYQAVTIEAVSQTSNLSGISDPASLDTNDANNVGTVEMELTAMQKLFPGADQNILEQLGENYLVIKKPEGNNLSLSLEDLYINKSIQLTLSGMTGKDINIDMISRVRGDDIFTGDPKYTETTTTEVDEEEGTSKDVVTRDYGDDISHGITITTSSVNNSAQYSAKILLELNTVYAYTIYEDNSYYYVDLRKPSDVYDKIIVIDAGHGGKDGGASSKDGQYLEKNLNLDIAKDLKELLDKENIKVYYTRTKDETVYLRPRVTLANSVDCDYFISIHCNSNQVSSPKGSEVLYYNNEFKGVKAFDLAKLFSKEIGETIPLENKGTVERHYEDLYIFDKSSVPMILIEVGYLSNSSDLNYLIKPENQKSIARGIYNGIMKAYEKLPVEK